MQKLSKQLKFNDYEINARIATTNKNNPKAIFFEFTCHLKPLIEKDTYLDEIKYIKHKYRKAIEKFIASTKLFDKKYINNIEVSLNGLKLYKHSFLTIQTYLKQTSDPLLGLTEIKDKTINKLDELVLDLIKSITSKQFLPTKRKVD